MNKRINFKIVFIIVFSILFILAFFLESVRYKSVDNNFMNCRNNCRHKIEFIGDDSEELDASIHSFAMSEASSVFLRIFSVLLVLLKVVLPNQSIMIDRFPKYRFQSARRGIPEKEQMFDFSIAFLLDMR